MVTSLSAAENSQNIDSRKSAPRTCRCPCLLLFLQLGASGTEAEETAHTQSSVLADCESSPGTIKTDKLSSGLSWVTRMAWVAWGPVGLEGKGIWPGQESQVGVYWCGQEDQLCQTRRTDVAHLVPM